MPEQAIAIVILAAGRGTRMGDDLPKVLRPLAQVPMLHHVLSTAQSLNPERLILVTGFGAEAVTEAARARAPDIITVHQSKQLGTGHAARMALPALADFEGRVVVIYGDTPFITTERLEEMVQHSADVVVLGFEAADPGRYGRLILVDGVLDKIVEAKDIASEEHDTTLCNSGIKCVSSSYFTALVEAVDNKNAAQEFYLTDIVGIARAKGASTGVVIGAQAEALGIDTPQALRDAEVQFQIQARLRLIENGVVLASPETVHLAQDTAIGRDAYVEPYVVFGPGVTVETGAHIRSFSHIEGAHISRGAVIGPYARLRPGAEVSENAKIGNFVEVKNAEIGAAAKVNHLSYVGDARIGAGSNVGAGTITCNYDGVGKHRTTIGQGAFIGSNTLLVAPVTIGDGAYTATGSVITDDVPTGDLAIGRARQVNKKGLGARLMARLKALKSEKAG
ncbi:MAG: bifunctional UDP-N-acetylglucosamine diphosphorylase/glucosamine-1-phosphate N-acetyltransferase GlmU [Pseudomonadota bacterium]